MNTQPPALPNRDDKQLARMVKMLKNIRNPLYKFLIESVVTALQTWQNMPEQERGKYA
jgi:hypothetical protein